MSERLRREWLLLPAIALAVVIFGIALGHDATLVQAGTYAAIYAIAAIGLSLLLGNVAQISLGQAGFFGIGAYTFAYLTTGVAWPAAVAPWLQYVVATLAAMLLAALFGCVLGFIALRFRGHYLAMSTLAFGLVAAGVFREVPILGGSGGITNVPFPQFGPLTISGNAAYWYAWLLAGIVALVTLRLLGGRTGRAFEAIRNDELAAEVAGVPTKRYKIAAFTYAGALAGLGGSLYAGYLGLIVPDAVSVTLSIDLLLMVVLGGAGGVCGAIVGATAIGISNVYGHSLENVRPILYGLAVVTIAIVFPRGVVGSVRFRRRPGPVPALAPASVDVAIPARSDVGESSEALQNTRTAPQAPWLAVAGVTKRFGGLTAVDDVAFELRNGALTSLIGPNGAGKTTLFNAICGVGRTDAGTITIAGHPVAGARPHVIAELGVARSFQNARLFAEMTVLENVFAGGFTERGFTRENARAVLARLGLEPLAETTAKDLAFGDRRRVELARAIAGKPGLLLLDEPAAGLNASERDRLRDDLRRLRDDGFTMLLIEHDMRLVMDISDRVIVLEFGRIIADGAPGYIRNDPAVIAAYLGVAG